MADTAPETASPPRRRRLWRWLLLVPAALVVVLAGVAWWATTEGSLPRALQVAQKYLPGDQQLEYRDAQGSITGGGRIGHLQWSRPGTVLAIDDLRVEWSLRQLFGRALHVRVLSARNVFLQLTPQPEQPDGEPFVMPEEVTLPLHVRLPLAVTRIQVDSIDAQGATSTQVIEDVVAHYGYDGTLHELRLEGLRYGQSRLQGQLALNGDTLELTSEFAASLRDMAPGMPFAMVARIAADGRLSGGNAARLDATVDARELAPGAALPDGDVLLAQLSTLRVAPQPGAPVADGIAQLHARAIVHPWRDQPLQQLDLAASGLDARAFHAAAPGTALRGLASVQPAAGAASTWDIALDFTNDQAGSMGAQLPLHTLVARARLSSTHLQVQAAEAAMRADANAPAGTVTFEGEVPLEQPTQASLRLALRDLDLAPWGAGLPRTQLAGEASMAPLTAQEGWQVRADVGNGQAGPLDRDLLPLDQLVADARFTPERWRADSLALRLDEGRVQLQGEFDPAGRVLQVRGELQRLPLRRIHTRLAAGAASVLSGTLGAQGDLDTGVAFDADIAGNAPAGAVRGQWDIRAVQARGNWSPTRLVVERVDVDAFEARIEGSEIAASLPGFETFAGRLQATAPGLALEADAAMQAQSGEGRLALQLSSAEQVVAWLHGLPVIGARMTDLQARGTASLDADWEGGWRQWIEGLSNPAAHPQLRAQANLQAQALRVQLPAADAAAPPTVLDIDSLTARMQGNLGAASLEVEGDARLDDRHALLDVGLQMTQSAGEAGPMWTVAVARLAASATLPGQAGPWQVQVGEGLQVTLRATEGLEVGATAGEARLLPPQDVAPEGAALVLAWEPLQFRRSAQGAMRLQSSGRVSGLHAAWIDALLAPGGSAPLADAGLATDLVASGEWDVSVAERLDVRAHLRRDSGDLWLGDPAIDDGDGADAADAMREVERVRREGVAAGIRTLDVTVRSEGEDIALALDWDTERAGVITARVRTRLEQQGQGWRLPEDAPLAGTLQARLQDLGTWGVLAPPGWRVRGELGVEVTLDGTVQSPDLRGTVEGNGLGIRSVLDGVDLREGVLRANLAGRSLEITQLTLQGGTGSRAHVRGLSGNRTPPPTARGSMDVTGTIDWSGVADAAPGQTGIAMDLVARLQKMQVLVRNDRQLSLGGDLAAGLQQGRLRVRGELVVDRAAIMLPEAGAPTLGDDVVVVSNSDLQQAGDESAGARTELQTALPMDLQIKLDLGRDLALEGYGITTRLAGELTISSTENGSDPFRIVGEVRTDEGRFRAWGQALNVETGVVLFNGPYSNPSLNLLAIRPEIAVRAGVRVTGTLNAPRATLYSEPEMPESEKLSWVMLGRASATSGAEGASMQQAALGLLAGGVGSSLAAGLGLDELGLGDSGVSVGKRISDELYVTYEAGLSGAASTLYIFYDITRRFTVRGQTGEASAVDVIYTITYD